jgi:hypothetical protein
VAAAPLLADSAEARCLTIIATAAITIIVEIV